MWSDATAHRTRDAQQLQSLLAISALVTSTAAGLLFRKRSEQMLRESETCTRAITDSAQDAILMIGQNGQISYWNPAVERILGYTSICGGRLRGMLSAARIHVRTHSQRTCRDEVDRRVVFLVVNAG